MRLLLLLCLFAAPFGLKKAGGHGETPARQVSERRSRADEKLVFRMYCDLIRDAPLLEAGIIREGLHLGAYYIPQDSIEYAVLPADSTLRTVEAFIRSDTLPLCYVSDPDPDEYMRNCLFRHPWQLHPRTFASPVSEVQGPEGPDIDRYVYIPPVSFSLVVLESDREAAYVVLRIRPVREWALIVRRNKKGAWKISSAREIGIVIDDEDC